MKASMLRACDWVEFREEGTLQLAPASARGCAECWVAAKRANPALFDGPIVLASGLHWDGRRCSIGYMASTYSKYVWMRSVAGSDEPRVGSLYASVLAMTADGYLLTGRMSGSTSTPGQIQLPGGNLEPRSAALTEGAARTTAARELAEETGVVLEATALTLTHIISSKDSADVGILYTVTLACTLSEVEQRFLAHTRLRDNEFDQLVAFTRGQGVMCEAPGQAHDYLAEVIAQALRLRPGRLEYVEVSDGAGEVLVTVGVDIR